MTTPTTARREFIGQIATAAVALAGTACVGAHAQTAPTPAVASSAPKPPAPTDGWTARITGTHKVVFDSPEIGDGMVIGNALLYMKGYTEMYKLADRDLSVVMVIRHAAIPMAMDDEFWRKYELGKLGKIKNPMNGKRADHNVFWKSEDKNASAYTLDALRERGAILLGCGRAASGLAYEIAERTKQQSADVMTELRAHLIPGLELAPSGIFAVTRAQEAGCTYVRST